MSSFQPVIKWSGSKRSQANTIIQYIPRFNRYYEPFIGGGSMVYAVFPSRGICGDIFEPLINLWKQIQSDYNNVYKQYKIRWERLQNEGQSVYYEIRNAFNTNHDVHDFLFLTRTCVNGLTRFNKNGDFNNSLHLTRKGIEPKRFYIILSDWSKHLKNINFRSGEYFITTQDVKEGDFVYLDPPYFHTKGQYFGTINFSNFINYLDSLNKKGVKYALSFDGKRENTDYTVELPKELYKQHLMIPSGNSSFKKVMGKKSETVYESLYLNYKNG